MLIPLTLTRIGNILKTFSASEELGKCSSNLYVSVLETLEQVLKYYKSNSASLCFLFSVTISRED